MSEAYLGYADRLNSGQVQRSLATRQRAPIRQVVS